MTPISGRSGVTPATLTSGVERRVRDRAAGERQDEQAAHQPSVGKNAVRSRCVSPVTSSTSSTRA